MYTATLLGNTVDKQARRRIVTIKFDDGVSEFTKDFSFAVETEVEVMKRTVKQYLDELNFVIEEITDLDYVEPTPETPTQDELDKQAWEADFARLEKVKRLIDCGVLTGTETQIVTLRNKVKADFKPTYL
jgi:uncharacterized protein YneR